MTLTRDNLSRLGVPKEKMASSLPAFHIVGDAFVDLFCFGEWPEKGGDAQLSQPIRTFAGGSSTNTTTHLTALMRYFTNDDKNTLCLQTILNPDDHYGRILLNHADDHGYPLVNCKQEDDTAATGHCVAIVAGEERSFMTFRGCVDNFKASHLDAERIINSNCHVHLHLAGYFNLSGFQEGQAFKVFTSIRNQRKEKFPHLATIFSLVPQHDATRMWNGGIDEMTTCLDFLILNDLEALHIMEKGKLRSNPSNAQQSSPPDQDELIRQCASYFGEICPQTCVVVTRGPSGALALLGGKVIAEQSTVKVVPVDPTGAGDSFAAGFMYGLWAWRRQNGEKEFPSDGFPWSSTAMQESLRWGCAMGTSAVLLKGASIPSSKQDILRFYKDIKMCESRMYCT